MEYGSITAKDLWADVEAFCEHSLPSHREQRELQVLAAQTADSTAIADAMVSAAGRRFAEELVESRQRFAALCDWNDRDA